MENIFKYEGFSDGVVIINSYDDYKNLYIEIVDCDHDHKISVRLSADEIGVLVNALSDWFDIASRRR